MNEAFEKWFKGFPVQHGRFGALKTPKRIAEQAWEAATPQWQPIETAPKDGTHILSYQDTFWKEDIVYWDDEVARWKAKKSKRILHPTHWQPLPEPPKIP